MTFTHALPNGHLKLSIRLNDIALHLRGTPLALSLRLISNDGVLFRKLSTIRQRIVRHRAGLVRVIGRLTLRLEQRITRVHHGFGGKGLLIGGHLNGRIKGVLGSFYPRGKDGFFSHVTVSHTRSLGRRLPRLGKGRTQIVLLSVHTGRARNTGVGISIFLEILSSSKLNHTPTRLIRMIDVSGMRGKVGHQTATNGQVNNVTRQNRSTISHIRLSLTQASGRTCLEVTNAHDIDEATHPRVINGGNGLQLHGLGVKPIKGVLMKVTR